MEKLTQKEEELMRIFWDRGALFVREIVDLYPDPKPHFNTLSTFVRLLESKGYVKHEAVGNSYRYYPVVNEEEFSKTSLKDVIRHCFNDSYMSAVSALVEEDKISIDELKELIERVEKQKL